MAKRLIFSTRTPNDQGGIIPNESIDFSRYKKNPVLLREHRWGSDPLGIMTDLKLKDGVWSGIPVFHLETQESREAAGMYEKDSLNASSIGGFALWKKNPVTNDYVLDKKGLKLCEKYLLYEISLVGLPSNEDAVGEQMNYSADQLLQLSAAKFYDEDPEAMELQLTTLSSKFHYKQTSTMKKIPGQQNAADTNDDDLELEPDTNAAGEPEPDANAARQPAKKPAAPTKKATQAANALPRVIQDALDSGVAVTFSPARHTAPPPPAPEPDESQPGKVPGDVVQPTPIGLAADKAYKAFQRATQKAERALEAAKKAKADAEADDADEMAAKLATSLTAVAEKAIAAAQQAEEDYNSAQEEADEEAQSAATKAPTRTNLSAAERHGGRQATPAHNAATTPVMKTVKQMGEELTLAAAPSIRASVRQQAQGITFTALNASNADANSVKLLKRVFMADRTTTDQVSVSDHAVVLSSILNDKRLSAFKEKVRLHANVSDQQVSNMRMQPQGAQGGMDLMTLSADLQAGRATYWNRETGQMDALTMLTSTDNALAAPALNTIEWLSLAIFQLYPTSSWKAPIPMLPAAITGANTGTIWTNVAAAPAYYKGAKPVPADYVYTDTAVSMALTPYWMQPMVWNPLTMHQLRYDQQSTGWAQAFAGFNTFIDDNLIYTISSTVPAGSIIGSSGVSGYQANPMSFNIPNSGLQNRFYWSPNYAGNLLNPVLNDVLAIEQVYRNQNFELEKEKSMLIIDPIMERYLAQDPETKSLLTSFLTRDGETFLSYKHTLFNVRSRVAVYDPTTGQVKDINAAIPATAQSAALSIIPSQTAMGLGKLDVFATQDPSVYGYRMSADLRTGIAALRANFYGTALYYYGLANV